jgi:hypothetical protein
VETAHRRESAKSADSSSYPQIAPITQMGLKIEIEIGIGIEC